MEINSNPSVDNSDSQTLLNKVYEMYTNEKLNENSVCIECRIKAKEKGKELLYGPVPIYHIGKNFNIQKKKLLIVGIVAYGWGNDIINEDIWHSINSGEKIVVKEVQNKISQTVRELYSEDDGKYWIWLKYALSKIFVNDDDAFESVSITNLIHCNTGSVTANLPQFVISSCIDPKNLGLLKKEIEILQPTHIAILTWDYKYNKHYKDYVWLDGVKYVAHEIKHPRVSSKDEFATSLMELMNQEIVI
jgi:hypothetical protein